MDLSEEQSIADILWFLSALFDGPPPENIWGDIPESVWSALNPESTVGPTPSQFRADQLKDEYVHWLLVPDPGAKFGLYPDPQDLPDQHGVEWQWEILVAVLDVPWKKDEFVDGRAYPMRPNHLSVLLAVLAILLELPWDRPILDHTVDEWFGYGLALSRTILARLVSELPDNSGYRAIAASAQHYLAGLDQWHRLIDSR